MTDNFLKYHSPSKQECQRYLENYQISEGKYTTGLYDSGITIYKQQVRSLNLFYALNRCGLITKKTTVAVIGGGIAGLTFAAAAIKANLSVSLLEKESVFLHLQTGCDIREVYPHLYNWPDKGASYPYAGLPVLSWKADSASKVAKQIIQSFNRLRMSYKKAVALTDTTIGSIKNNKKGGFTIIGRGRVNRKKPEMIRPFYITSDLIIYCTGFGIETATQENGRTPSYWRNDDFAQTVVNRHHSFLISGTGDGALIDLFRIKILGFSYDSFLKKYEANPHEKYLTENLALIKEAWMTQKENSDDFLYARFSKLKPAALKFLETYISHRLRSNMQVKLVSEKALHEILNLNKISFINAFIFFLLIRINGENEVFEYKNGKTMFEDDGYIVETEDKNAEVTREHVLAHPIIRHGTKRESAFIDTDITQADLQSLKDKQTSKKFSTDTQLWEFSTIFQTPNSLQSRMGFLTEETVSFFMNVPSVMNAGLLFACRNLKIKPDFRLTLLRVIQSEGKYYYQQICPYFGSKSSLGNVGKIFPFMTGNVGLSIVTGEPFLLVNKNRKFAEVLNHLHVKQSPTIMETNASCSIPILSKVNNKLATNLIFYIDSGDRDFFNNEAVIVAILTGVHGLVDSLHKSLNTHISVGELTFEPITVMTDKVELEKSYPVIGKVKKSGCYVDLISKYPEFAPLFTSPLLLDEFQSFDMFYKTSQVSNDVMELN